MKNFKQSRKLFKSDIKGNFQYEHKIKDNYCSILKMLEFQWKIYENPRKMYFLINKAQSKIL